MDHDTPSSFLIPDSVTLSPAPWKIEKPKVARGNWITDGRGIYIALACICSNEQIEDANAHLIAAAPDLLEAVRELLSVVSDMHGLPETEEGEPCTEMCINSWCNEFGCIPLKLEAARAAIAKAEGRS